MGTNQSSQNTAATKKKVSRSETGHLKNVTNFEDLISFCSSFGARFNPSNGMLTIDSLKAKYLQGKEALAGHTVLRTKLNSSIDMRRIEFSDLQSTSTRSFNSFAVSGAEPLIVENAKSHLSKLRGQRKKEVAVAISEESSQETKEVKKISVSQMSFDRQIDNFSSMIEVYLQSGNYNPNEEDLKIEALNTKVSKLKDTNSAVINDYTAFSNGLIQRDDVLYNPLTGIVNTAQMVKKYVKSVFGANSPQYKQISSIEFRKK